MTTAKITAQHLSTWYKQHARVLPWRLQQTPWRTLVSEFLLQQTQIATIAPRYETIMQLIPTPQACARLSDRALEQLWQGLGYYRRAKYLRQTAQRIEQDFAGKVPTQVDDLLKLPGIGPYTAGAIAAIAFNQEVPGVDGNIIRVFTRLHNQALSTTAAKQPATAWLRNLYRFGEPAILMQALMDLGATLCQAKKPQCQLCPLRQQCLAYAKHTVLQRPLPVQKKEKPVQCLTQAWVYDDNYFYLQMRPAGLLGERPGPLIFESSQPPKKITDPHGQAALIMTGKHFRHTFTHLHWDITPALYYWPVLDNQPSFARQTHLQIPLKQINHVGLPRAFSKSLDYLAIPTLPIEFNS